MTRGAPDGQRGLLFRRVAVTDDEFGYHYVVALIVAGVLFFWWAQMVRGASNALTCFLSVLTHVCPFTLKYDQTTSHAHCLSKIIRTFKAENKNIQQKTRYNTWNSSSIGRALDRQSKDSDPRNVKFIGLPYD